MNHRCWQPFFNLTMACTRSGLSLDRSTLSSGSAAKLKRYVAFVGTGGGGAGLVDLMGVVGGSLDQKANKETNLGELVGFGEISGSSIQSLVPLGLCTSFQSPCLENWKLVRTNLRAAIGSPSSTLSMLYTTSVLCNPCQINALEKRLAKVLT